MFGAAPGDSPGAESRRRIVARGDEIGADTVGIFEQFAEFKPVVAHHTRIRRAGGSVFGDEVIDDAGKIVAQIQRVKWNLERLRHAACIFRIGSAAASLLVIGTRCDDRQ